MTRAYRRIVSTIGLMQSAIAAAAATRAHRMPRRDDLARLGIDAERFASIRL
ncbi:MULTISPECIES: hypothetical protein [unclassified Paracoccus (in: a-proteobacteria)]|uniref:hypothetical protein n=1 Tax=unclassified Paracoccus (in: a-proteobacteria) TaxID=2688777 RepID=UPI0018A6D28B|nr:MULTISPECIES: hypothetical protein [unclassified Paracoccus (in: a-proteobacteria)]UXU75647.1 hypothetical protein GB879_003905 [Paracoccus sp. SMMA_5]UXU81552.1 hypothetical protein GB880_003895 [Paracoccus sp. SMMA_5_TC]